MRDPSVRESGGRDIRVMRYYKNGKDIDMTKDGKVISFGCQ